MTTSAVTLRSAVSAGSPAILLDSQLAACSTRDMPPYGSMTGLQVQRGDTSPQLAEVVVTRVFVEHPEVAFLELASALDGSTAMDYFEKVSTRQEGFDVVDDLIAGKKTVRHQRKRSRPRPAGGIFCYLFHIC